MLRYVMMCLYNVFLKTVIVWLPMNDFNGIAVDFLFKKKQALKICV